MDPKHRNAAALHKRADDLIRLFLQNYQSILQRIGPSSTSITSNNDTNNNNNDEDSSKVRQGQGEETQRQTPYSEIAYRELSIKEDTMNIIKAAQSSSTLIRDLQELWLFGSLDTVADPADLIEEREMAIQIADVIAGLARRGPSFFSD
ncbi:unnamed protein product [Periconia digitata]|uniref:Uncharacterized protein n=1 Tax=Periconia digitata TaxID=1303443 RepID=A0A9W4UGQ1_9PLEO|nr:unnamed protein product [Periconia digitata]